MPPNIAPPVHQEQQFVDALLDQFVYAGLLEPRVLINEGGFDVLVGDWHGAFTSDGGWWAVGNRPVVPRSRHRLHCGTRPLRLPMAGERQTPGGLGQRSGTSPDPECPPATRA